MLANCTELPCPRPDPSLGRDAHNRASLQSSSFAFGQIVTRAFFIVMTHRFHVRAISALPSSVGREDRSRHRPDHWRRGLELRSLLWLVCLPAQLISLFPAGNRQSRSSENRRLRSLQSVFGLRRLCRRYSRIQPGLPVIAIASAARSTVPL